MAKFNQVVLQAVENGFTVSITKLELTERGYQPSESHFIAHNLEDALEIVKEGGPPAKLKLAK
jgi:hypothetical protein